MKRLVWVAVIMFAVAALFGCSKKKKVQETALDNMTNGVVSENVVSVTDTTAGNSSVPLVVDNAEAIPQSTGEMAPGAVALKEQLTVKDIQQALKNAGFYKGKVDGTIGPKTKKAIKDFQAKNGLKADGKVGPKTWKILSTYLNQTSEVANPTAQTQTVSQ